MPVLPFIIRRCEPADEDPVLELSLTAWRPVFASVEAILGSELSVRLHGDWRSHQQRLVRDALADRDMTVWVAESARRVIGFVAARVVDAGRAIGEIYLLAVDPDAQSRGVGTALTETATTWLREAGLGVAMISTGGDPAHAPARRVYEKAGYTFLPAAGYYKAL
jgi:GNAT superfamily N-acetyltransferase